MTVEEKREILRDYCGSKCCSDCKLHMTWVNNFCPSCIIIDFATEAELDRALEIIKEDNTPLFDSVNRPAHYTDGKIEVIDYIEDKKLGFCLGNAIKYISRAGKKDPEKEVEDLNKAIWYINRRIKEIMEAK